MSKIRVSLVLLLGLLGYVTAGGDISTLFTTCKVHDPNLNECLKGAIQAALLKLADGMEELNMPVIDPLFIKEATIPAGTGAIHFEQIYKNIKFYNLARTTKINNVNAIIKPDGFKIDLDVFSPEYRMEAEYKVDGKIMVLPIVGNGQCVIKLDDIKTQIHIVGETIKTDGKIYGNIKTIKFDFLPKKVVFKFDDFISKDPNLNREINNLLNEKWKEVFHDVKDNYSKLISDILVKYANEVFHHFEFGSLFIE